MISVQMNRFMRCSLVLLAGISTFVCASQQTKDYEEDPLPSEGKTFDDGQKIGRFMSPSQLDIRDISSSDLEGRDLLDSSISNESLENGGMQHRGLFAAFEGRSKHGKYRGGAMFYGGRMPFGDYFGYSGQYSGYGRPFGASYPGNYRGQFGAGYGRNRNRYSENLYGPSYASSY